MINREEGCVERVFYYGYRPINPENAMPFAPAGFDIYLQFDDMLIVDELNFQKNSRALQIIHRYEFRMPSKLRMDVLKLIDQCTWLSEAPQEMRLRHEGRVSRMQHLIGLNSWPNLFVVDDMGMMIRQPFADADGRIVRRMFCMLQDLASLLAVQGIELCLHDASYNKAVIKPCNEIDYLRMQQTASGTRFGRSNYDMYA